MYHPLVLLAVCASSIEGARKCLGRVRRAHPKSVSGISSSLLRWCKRVGEGRGKSVGESVGGEG